MQSSLTQIIVLVMAFAAAPGLAQAVAQSSNCEVVNFDCRGPQLCANSGDCQYWLSNKAYHCCFMTVPTSRAEVA